MSVPILEVVDVHAAYGRIEVLRGVDLSIPKGAVLALLGPNGAGKSTLTKIVSGQKKPTSGDVHLGGVNVRDARPDELARVGLCTVPEGRSVFPNLTVEENLLLMSYAGVAAPAVLDTAFSYFPRLHERRHQLAGTMSGGEQQMLAMSRALASDPALLILDELSMGLAPLIVDELYETVSQIAASRRLHPVHRAVRPHRAARRRLRRRDERRPGGRHRRARRDPRDHVRRHPGRGGMKRVVIPIVAAGLAATSLSFTAGSGAGGRDVVAVPDLVPDLVDRRLPRPRPDDPDDHLLPRPDVQRAHSDGRLQRLQQHRHRHADQDRDLRADDPDPDGPAGRVRLRLRQGQGGLRQHQGPGQLHVAR